MEMMVQIEHPTREGEKEQMFKGIIVTAYTSLIVYMNLSIYGSLNKHPGIYLGPDRRAPAQGRVLKVTIIRLNLLGSGPHHRPIKYPAPLWDQTEFDRGYGRWDGRDAKDGITRKDKVESPNFDRHLDPISISMKFQIAIGV